MICLTSRSPYHFIYQALISGKFKLAVSVDILLEYEEVLQRKYSLATAKAFTTLLTELPNVYHINPHYRWQLIEGDADDNRYCDCAIVGQAHYLVTEDRHFDVLKRISFPRLTTIDLGTFFGDS